MERDRLEKIKQLVRELTTGNLVHRKGNILMLLENAKTDQDEVESLLKYKTKIEILHHKIGNGKEAIVLISKNREAMDLIYTTSRTAHEKYAEIVGKE